MKTEVKLAVPIMLEVVEHFGAGICNTILVECRRLILPDNVILSFDDDGTISLEIKEPS